MMLVINSLTTIAVLYLFAWTAKKCFNLLKIYKINKKISPADVVSVAEDIAGVSKIAVLFAGLAATLAAPAGIMSIASAMGLVPRPFIIIALPAFIVFAAVSASISAGAKLYAKSVREKRSKQL